MRLPDRDGSRAVLIGVGAYEHMPVLTGVHAGAKELHAVLTDPEHGSLRPEHCALLPEGASTAEVGDAIAAAADSAKDLLLIYFAGHGVRGQRRGDLHLALTGTRGDRVEFTGIAWQFVRDYVLHSTARFKVNILDCCFSGRARGLTMSAGTDVLAAVAIEGSATMTSVPPNEQSIILPGEEYPAYTKRLLELLRTGIAGEAELLSLPRLHHHLYARLQAAGLRQPEAEWVALIDRLGLVRNRARHQPEPALQAEPSTPSPTEVSTAVSQSVHAETKPSGDAPTKIERDVKSPDPAVRAQAYRATIDSISGQLGAAAERERKAAPPPKSLRQRISEAAGPYFSGVALGFVVPPVVLSFTNFEENDSSVLLTPGLIIFVVLAVVMVLVERFVPDNRTAATGFGVAAGVATVFSFSLSVVPGILGISLPFLYLLAVRLLLSRAIR